MTCYKGIDNIDSWAQASCKNILLWRLKTLLELFVCVCVRVYQHCRGYLCLTGVCVCVCSDADRQLSSAGCLEGGLLEKGAADEKEEG